MDPGDSAVRRSPHPLATLRTDDDPADTLPLPNLTPTRAQTPAFPRLRSSITIPAARDFLPSFVTSHSSRRNGKGTRRVGPTAWVDGLRGIAALLVLVFHFTYRMTNTNLAWGADSIPESYAFWRLPVIRLLSSGSAMVSLFFLISGYALSYRPLQLVRAASKARDASTTESSTVQAQFVRHMASAVLRRPIRLFLPVVISSVLIFVLLRIGIYDLVRPIAANQEIFPISPQENHVDYKDSLFAQLVHWYVELSDLTHNAFGDNFFGGNFEYDQHMWTIPVELRSSLVLFLSLIPTIAMKSMSVRMWYWVGLLVWSVDGGKWEMILFYSGALIADWDIYRLDTFANKEDSSPNGTVYPSSPTGDTASLAPAPETPLIVMLALLVLSYPEEKAAVTPLYHFLAAITPRWFMHDFRFWQVLAGSVLFATISQSSSLKRPLESRPVQYLGRISYGLYLMHGPVIHTIGYAVLGFLHTPKEELGPVKYLTALTITAAASIWAGDIWWRGVDAKCVGWAKRFSDAVLAK